jgi:hypothetical protein
VGTENEVGSGKQRRKEKQAPDYNSTAHPASTRRYPLPATSQ